jgi:hypothetical protein
MIKIKWVIGQNCTGKEKIKSQKFMLHICGMAVVIELWGCFDEGPPTYKKDLKCDLSI